MVKNIPENWEEAVRVLDQNFRELRNQVIILQKKLDALKAGK
jgi:hypothetical protein